MTVREYGVPARQPRDPSHNLTDLVESFAQEQPDKIAFSRLAGETWQDVTAREFRDEVLALAKGLVAAGIQPGDRVALMSATRYEWTLADFAIWFAGAVTVPIYETSSPEQVAWILSDSRATACFVDRATHEETVGTLRSDLPRLGPVWVFDHGVVDELVRLGTDVPDERIEKRRRTLTGESLATVIYTSGTTGRPKGCELTHANFADPAAEAVARLNVVVAGPDASTLLFLPLAHVFARFIQVICLEARARMGHSSSVKNLLADLSAFRPTFVLAVPRVFEKIYNSSDAIAVAGHRGGIFRRAARTAIEYSTALESGGRGPGRGLRVRHAIFDRLVYARLRAALGGKVAWAVSGGAPLGARLGHFFRGIGVTVLEGWGLTETTAAVSVNCPDRIRVGTVGLPLPGVSVSVAEDGELLVRGLNVMRGYHNDAEATAEAFVDGWFRTGDLGEIDDDGFITITGRKKELLVTAGGKNVAPTALEDRLRSHPLISQCMVVGDDRPYIAALITLDAEMLPIWLVNHGREPMDVATAAEDPGVRAAVQAAVDRTNHSVSRAESIRRFAILDTDFTEAGGQLTPKQSLRRAVVSQEFAAAIEALYR